MSNQSASFGSRSLKLPFSIMLTLKNFSGIEKCAPAESPTTPTPSRVDLPHNFSSRSAPFASLPNIALQSWSREDLPSFLPGQTLASSSLQSAPLQWQPLKVLMSEQESLSRSKGGLCLSPKRLANKSMSHCQGLGLDSSLKSSWQSMRGVTSSTSFLSCVSGCPSTLHCGFLQRLEEWHIWSVFSLLMSPRTMWGPAQWTNASQVGLSRPSKKVQNSSSTNLATSLLWQLTQFSITRVSTVHSAHLSSKPFSFFSCLKSALVHFCWMPCSLGYISWKIWAQCGIASRDTTSSMRKKQFIEGGGGRRGRMMSSYLQRVSVWMSIFMSMEQTLLVSPAEQWSLMIWMSLSK